MASTPLPDGQRPQRVLPVKTKASGATPVTAKYRTGTLAGLSVGGHVASTLSLTVEGGGPPHKGRWPQA